MKLINPTFEILENKKYDIDSIYKQIELAGRTCYKSEAYITDTSAKEFVERMMKLGHGAMLEHGTLYLKLDMSSRDTYFKYCSNKYTKTNSIGEAEKATWEGFVTTNLRVLFENKWMDDLQYLCKPTEYHEKRITVKFICDRGVSHEFVRHRVFSFAQESTRYCNYSKEKFGNEITCIIPSWYDLKDGVYVAQYLRSVNNGTIKVILNYNDGVETVIHNDNVLFSFVQSLQESEMNYFKLIDLGWTAQQARQLLPNALKTELVMTGFISDWKHFFELRTPGSAHPDARALAIPLQEEFKKLNLIK